MRLMTVGPDKLTLHVVQPPQRDSRVELAASSQVRHRSIGFIGQPITDPSLGQDDCRMIRALFDFLTQAPD